MELLNRLEQQYALLLATKRIVGIISEFIFAAMDASLTCRVRNSSASRKSKKPERVYRNNHTTAAMTSVAWEKSDLYLVARILASSFASEEAFVTILLPWLLNIRPRLPATVYTVSGPARVARTTNKPPTAPLGSAFT